MIENQELMDAIHSVMNKHMMSLDSYDRDSKTYWLVSDDFPLISVTDIVKGIASVRMIIDNVQEKAEKGGLSCFDFFMNIAKSCSYYSIELEKGRFVVFSLVIHEYSMLEDAVGECMDVYKSYVNALKACYPFL